MKVEAVAFSAYCSLESQAPISAEEVVGRLVDSGGSILDPVRRALYSDPNACIAEGNIFLKGFSHPYLKQEELQPREMKQGTAALGFGLLEQWLFISQSSKFRDVRKLDQLCCGLVELSKALHDIGIVSYGWLDARSSRLPNRSKVTRGELEYVCWGSFFGSDLVDLIGRRFLQNAPAYRIDEFDNGAIFVQATQNFSQWLELGQTEMISYFSTKFSCVRTFSAKMKQ